MVAQKYSIRNFINRMMFLFSFLQQNRIFAFILQHIFLSRRKTRPSGDKTGGKRPTFASEK